MNVEEGWNKVISESPGLQSSPELHIALFRSMFLAGISWTIRELRPMMGIIGVLKLDDINNEVVRLMLEDLNRVKSHDKEE